MTVNSSGARPSEDPPELPLSGTAEAVLDAAADAEAASGEPPLTRPARFAEVLSTLPAPLRDLMSDLRPHVAPGGKRDPSRAVYVPVRLAMDAWGAGDMFAAHSLLLQAARVAAELTPPEPADGTVTGPGGWPVFPPEPAPPARFQASLHGHVADLMTPLPDGPVYAATDASWRGNATYGHGYATTTGLWGVRSARILPRSAAAPGYEGSVDSAALHELHAVAHLMQWLTRHLPADHPVVLLCDSRSAQRYLRAWQSGAEPRFPAGERALRPYNGEFKPLQDLAQAMRSRPRIKVTDVVGHSGHLLNELADALAKMARRRADGETVDLVARGSDITGAFLRAWDTGDDSRLGGVRAGRHRFTRATPVSRAV